MIKKTFLTIVIIFGIIQIFQINKFNPKIIESEDFINLFNTPKDKALLIKNACYDCHSNETKYPWYSNVQPIAWLLKNHIDEGREELNFSTFGTYSTKRQLKKLDECIEMIEEDEMPMSSYLLMHPKSKLSKQQKIELIQYFQELSNQIGIE